MFSLAYVKIDVTKKLENQIEGGLFMKTHKTFKFNIILFLLPHLDKLFIR